MKFSIILCTYNGAKFLEKTLNSILNQTYKKFEIIIVDDNSSDNTKSILYQYSEIKFVKIHYNLKNYGLGFCRNYAISLSSGDWITFLDQDDLYDKSRLTKIYNLIDQNKKINFFFHDTNYIDETDQIVSSHLFKYNLPFPKIDKKISTTLLLKYGSFIDSEAIAFKRNIFEIVGKFDESFTYLCDYDFFLKVSFIYPFFYSKDKLSSWRIHKDQQQKTNKNQKKERIRLFYKYFKNSNTDFKDKMYCLKTIFINLISIFKDTFR